MNTKRAFLAFSAVLGFTMVWGLIYHVLLLKNADQQIRQLYRFDLNDKMWLSVLGVLGISAFFVAGYRLCTRRGTIVEGIIFGTCFSVLAGLLVDLNQYVLYPIPALLVIKWYIGGLVEFAVNGALVSMIYPTRNV